MDSYEAFKQAADDTAKTFALVDKKEVIRVVSHLDADGICAASILIHALHKENRTYNLSILPQLKEENIRSFSKENHNVYVFTDLGSGQLDALQKYLACKTIFILDHHQLQNNIKASHIHQLNPCLFGIDGSSQISGAGVVYLFSKALTQSTDMSHIAIIGAIGDAQEDQGFAPLNTEILQDAIACGSIEVTRGLKFFGLQTRPLHKLLQYSTETVIPEVTGSESNALHFLQQLGINPHKGSAWKKLNDLTMEEKKKLIAAIVLKRAELPRPDDVLSNVYLLRNEEEQSPLREAKEFSTLLNSCGRLNKASLGIGACLNDPVLKVKAIQTLQEYKRAIMLAMQWYHENKHNASFVLHKEQYMIINAEQHIPANMIGTLTSILTMGNEFKKGFYVLSMAHNEDLTTKVSLRVAGRGEDVDLKSIITRILEKLGEGEGGGHVYAAGAVIPTEKEDEFLVAAQDVLDGLVVEEKVE